MMELREPKADREFLMGFCWINGTDKPACGLPKCAFRIRRAKKAVPRLGGAVYVPKENK